MPSHTEEERTRRRREAQAAKPYARQDFAKTSGLRPGIKPGDRKTIDMMGDLTNEEAQMVITESAKGRIGQRVLDDPTLHMSMYEKAAFRKGQQTGRLTLSPEERKGYTPQDIIDLGAPGARERQKQGTMSEADALALGVFKQKYKEDFGKRTINETVQDTRMVADRYGRRIPEARQRTRTVGLTLQDRLAEMNEKAGTAFAESEEINRAVAAEQSGREHEITLEGMRGGAGLAEARLRSEGLTETARVKATAQGGAARDAARAKAGAHIIDLYSQRDQMMNPSEGGVTPSQTQLAAMDARIKLAQKAYDEPAPADGGDSTTAPPEMMSANEAAKVAGQDTFVYGGKTYRVR